MKTIYFTIFLFLCSPFITNAQSPKTLSYQGVLTDAEGEVLPNNTYILTFGLYDALSSGNLLWEEDISAEVKNGLFNVILGGSEVLDLSFDNPYWLSISVDGGDELEPRTALTASPYSLGGKATELDLKDAADFNEGMFVEAGDTALYFVPTDKGMYIGPYTDPPGLRKNENGKYRSLADFLHINVETLRASVNANTAISGFALEGQGVNGTTNIGEGVYGLSGDGIGVRGISKKGIGILGESDDAYGIKGVGKGSLAGVFGESTEGRGILGKSINNIGVQGQSQSKIGVYGFSESKEGILGESTGNIGVMGISKGTEAGIYGLSVNGVGVQGKGLIAGYFEGDVDIVSNGQLSIDRVDAEEGDRVLVWGNSNIVKYRSLNEALGDGKPFDGCLLDKEFKVLSGENTIFYVKLDGTANVNGKLSVINNKQNAFQATSTSGKGIISTSRDSTGIYGYSEKWVGLVGESKMGTGVEGYSKEGHGVVGISDGDESAGVYGESEFYNGVYGFSSNRAGVRGQSEKAVGVYGKSVDSIGVIGESNTDTGVYGATYNEEGIGVFGEGISGIGVQGKSETSTGVKGMSNDSTGVYGITLAENQNAVFGESINGKGVKGMSMFNMGVEGISDSGVGVKGKSNINYAIFGESTQFNGVRGESKNDNGVYGFTERNIKAGVSGESITGTGVKGKSTTNYGIIGESIALTGVLGVGKVAAGEFRGDVLIEQNGRLKIDKVDAEDADKLLVWADDKFVKYRSLNDILPDDADMDPGNEIQTLTKDGPIITLDRMGGFVQLLDDDDKNEIQILSKDGSVITLDKMGQSVTLMDDDPTNELFSGTLCDKDLVVKFGEDSVFVIDSESRVGIEGAFGSHATTSLPAITGAAENNVSVYGYNDSPILPTGIFQNLSLTGPALSIIGNSFFGNGTNTYITFTPGQDTAAQFFGAVDVQGTFTALAKSFVIDHPLDPENKQLKHFSIESDQLTNIYNGNAIMDDAGEAWVELPEWFEALNTDFCYQLTCVGGFANVYIGEEMHDNRFKIAGGKEGLKVSWQVSGVRHDRQSLEIDQSVEILKQ